MIDVIPATNISFDKDFAWLVFDDHAQRGDRWWDSRRYMSDLDRPCDTCGGRKVLPWQPGELPGGGYCPKCIDGRHTFEIRHYQPCSCVGGLHEQGRCEGAWPLTKRVSIVPGMVLPIVEQTGDCPDDAHICVFYGHIGGEPHEQWVLYDGDCMEREIVIMPAATVPEQSWAVQLKVSKP